MAFAPALACLLAGQISLFALLGLVLFLRLHKTRPLLSGVSLWLCALRPHLFLPFCVVLILWIIATRSYKILLGALAALAMQCSVGRWAAARRVRFLGKTIASADVTLAWRGVRMPARSELMY